MTRILFVEDDSDLAELLKIDFDKRGFEVTWANNGEKGLRAFRQTHFDLCLLDVGLPGKDGFAVCRDIRKVDNEVPVIFLSAGTAYEDKIRAFELGADDYISKPFNTQELYLRIKAILKRTSRKEILSPEVIAIGHYIFDYARTTLRLGAISKHLSSKEADILNMLARHKGELVSRSSILNTVWGYEDAYTAKSMDVYMTKVRKLLKDDPKVEIQNVYGSGFKLSVTE